VAARAATSGVTRVFSVAAFVDRGLSAVGCCFESAACVIGAGLKLSALSLAAMLNGGKYCGGFDDATATPLDVDVDVVDACGNGDFGAGLLVTVVVAAAVALVVVDVDVDFVAFGIDATLDDAVDDDDGETCVEIGRLGIGGRMCFGGNDGFSTASPSWWSSSSSSSSTGAAVRGPGDDGDADTATTSDDDDDDDEPRSSITAALFDILSIGCDDVLRYSAICVKPRSMATSNGLYSRSTANAVTNENQKKIDYLLKSIFRIDRCTMLDEISHHFNRTATQ
jgi:hypothetical protein